MERFTKENSKNSQIKRNIILYLSGNKKGSCALPCAFQTVLEWNRMFAAHCNLTAHSLFWFLTMSQIFTKQPSPQVRITEDKLSSIHAETVPFTMTWDLWAGHLASLQETGSICKLTCPHLSVWYWVRWHQVIYSIPSISLLSLHTLKAISVKTNQVRFAQTLWVLVKRKKTLNYWEMGAG